MALIGCTDRQVVAIAAADRRPLSIIFANTSIGSTDECGLRYDAIFVITLDGCPS